MRPRRKIVHPSMFSPTQSESIIWRGGCGGGRGRNNVTRRPEMLQDRKIVMWSQMLSKMVQEKQIQGWEWSHVVLMPRWTVGSKSEGQLTRMMKWEMTLNPLPPSLPPAATCSGNPGGSGSRRGQPTPTWQQLLTPIGGQTTEKSVGGKTEIPNDLPDMKLQFL